MHVPQFEGRMEARLRAHSDQIFHWAVSILYLFCLDFGYVLCVCRQYLGQCDSLARPRTSLPHQHTSLCPATLPALPLCRQSAEPFKNGMVCYAMPYLGWPVLWQ